MTKNLFSFVTLLLVVIASVGLADPVGVADSSDAALLRSRRVGVSQWVERVSAHAESLVRTADCILWSWGVSGARCEATEALGSDADSDDNAPRDNAATTAVPPGTAVHSAAVQLLRNQKRSSMGKLNPFQQQQQHNGDKLVLDERSKRTTPSSSLLTRGAQVRRREQQQLGSTQSLLPGTTFDSIRMAYFTATNGPLSVLPSATRTQYCYLGQTSIAVGTVGSSSSGGNTTNWSNSSTLPNFSCTEGNTTTSVTAKEFHDLPPANRSRCVVNKSHTSYKPQCICPADYFLFQSSTTFYGCLPRNFSCTTSFPQALMASCHAAGYAEPMRTFDRCLSLFKDTDTASLSVNISCTTDGVAVQIAQYASLGAIVATPPTSTGANPVSWMPVSPTATGDVQPTGSYSQIVANRDAFPHYFSNTNTNSSSVLMSTFHPVATLGALELEFFDFDSPSSRNDTRVLYRLTNETNSAVPAPTASALQNTSSSNVNAVSGGWGALLSGYWQVSVPLSQLPDRVVAGGRLYLEMGLVAPFGLIDRYSISALQIELKDSRYVNPPGKIREYNQPLDAGTVALIAVLTAIGVGLVLVVVWKVCHREEAPEDDSIGAIKKKRRMEAQKKDQ